MADLKTIATEQYQPNVAFTVELDGPDEAPLFNDDGTRMTIDVLGADSDIAVKARNSNQNEYFAKGPRAKLTAESVTSKSDAYLAKCSTGWNVTINGEKPAFSREGVLKVYSDPGLSFIRDKVDAAIAERTNFLKRS